MKKIVVLPSKITKFSTLWNNIKNLDLSSIFFIKLKNANFETLKKYDVIIFENLNVKIMKKLSKEKIILISIKNHIKLNKYIDIFIDPLFNDKENFVLKNPTKNNPNSMIEQFFSLVELKYIINVFTILEWDSKFWNKKIAYIGPTRLTENILYRIELYTRKWGINMIQFLSNCHDSKTVTLAEENNFGFKDIRITLEKKISKNVINLKKKQNISFRVATLSDYKFLKSIIENSYLDSRYYFDYYFSVQKTKNFYYGWLKKGIQGKFDDICYIICHKKIPIGFCTCRINYKNSKTTGSIGLFGISQKFRDKGYSKLLLSYVEEQLLILKKKKISVVTQGRNYVAIRTYNNFGFSIKKTELWYHKWIESNLKKNK